MNTSKDPILLKDYRADYRSRLLRKESYERAFMYRRWSRAWMPTLITHFARKNWRWTNNHQR
jgi:hypothetical protein